MKKLIDLQTTIKRLRGECIAKYPFSYYFGLLAAADEIEKIPTVDATEVVRCKDCKHYDNKEGYKPICHKFEGLHGYPKADDFCSYGERRTDERTD